MEEEFPSLGPSSFFSIEANIKELKGKGPPFIIEEEKIEEYLLPCTSFLFGEEAFAKIALGWHAEGIAATILVEKPVERVSYPDLQRCDSVEFFFDTRDRKTSGFTNRFCHHFFFLPKDYEGHLKGEITRFRTDDLHPLAESSDLILTTKITSHAYKMQIFFPSKILVGYDPDDWKRIGFTYRINRPQGFSQHFSVSSDEYPFEGQPANWASLILE